MAASDLATEFRNLATWATGTSPLYESICRGVADDTEVRALAVERRPGQPGPHLLLAAVHYLLLAGADHRLASYYPSLSDDPADGDPYPAFREFALANAGAIRDLVADSRTQTNAVRRCAALVPAFELVSRLAGREPLSLVEVGASAGLNLLWDRYRYDYGRLRCGDPASPVTVRSVLDGDPVLPGEGADALPPVGPRVGVDLNPLDVCDDHDARWLRALVWPEHRERHRLLRGAVALAREDPPALRAGDALELLPGVFDDLPADRPAVVYNTQVLYQFDDAAVARYREALADAAGERELYWLSGEGAAPDREHGLELRLTVFDGDVREERVAVYEQHGRWVAWEGQRLV